MPRIRIPKRFAKGLGDLKLKVQHIGRAPEMRAKYGDRAPDLYTFSVSRKHQRDQSKIMGTLSYSPKGTMIERKPHVRVHSVGAPLDVKRPEMFLRRTQMKVSPQQWKDLATDLSLKFPKAKLVMGDRISGVRAGQGLLSDNPQTLNLEMLRRRRARRLKK